MSKIHTDPILGTFTWNEEQRYWGGSLTLRSGRRGNLDISPTGNHFEHPDSPQVFEGPRKIVAWLVASEGAAYAAVAEAMLPLYHDTWSEEGPITAEEFARRIELVTVWLSSDTPDANLWFTDGEMEMFGSHDINVYFDADARVTSAGLSG